MRQSLLLLTLLFLSACASQTGLQRTIHETDTFLLVLDQNPVPAQPEFTPPYNHPAQINPSDLEQILSAIKITPDKGMLMSFFSEKEFRHLFSSETVPQVARQLSDALLKANPDERINFYQTLPLNSSKVSATTGYLLVKDNQLHFRVNQFQVPLRKGSHPSRAGMNIRPTEKGKYAFSLAEARGMAHRSYKNMLGLEGSDPRWLVIDYTNFPLPGTETSDPLKQHPEKSLEERLRTLKHLRDEGLITEVEYTQKKQSLLEGL